MENLIETDVLTAATRIKEAFDSLYLQQRKMTSGQLEFINGLKKYFVKNKTLSEKQSSALFEMGKYMNNGAL